MKQDFIEYKNEFIFYLKTLNCFDRFVKNLRIFKKLSLDEYLKIQFHRNIPVTDLINNAFHWYSTNEGFRFWSEQEFKIYFLVLDNSYKNKNTDNSFWSD